MITMRPITAFAMAGLLAAMTSVSARAEVVSTSPNGFVTRDTAQIAAPPMTVWLALTKPGEWWTDEHTWSGDAGNLTLTPQAGGCFCETIPGDDAGDASAMNGSARHAIVVQAFPLKVLRLRGGLGPLQGEPAEGVLTITLKEIPGGTRVLWEYNVGGPMRFEIPAIAAAVDQVMSQQLTGLHLGPLGDDTRSVPSETSAPQEATADDSEAPTFDEEFESLTDED
jgi:uncharacterized protein YndB with AHSA1/START domain